MDQTEQIPITKDAPENKEGTNDTTQGEPIDNSLKVSAVTEYENVAYTSEYKNFVFMASVKAPYFRASKRAPIDLICVVDESGSMMGERIELVKKTVSFIIQNLETNDRFGIVGYSDSSHRILELTKMDAEGRELGQSKVKQIRAHGSTALCDGLCLGVQMMRERKEGQMNSVASVMLFTDGDANVGPTDALGIIRATMNPNYKPGSGRGYGGYGSSFRPQQRMQRRNAPPKPSWTQKMKDMATSAGNSMKNVLSSLNTSSTQGQTQQQASQPPQIQQQQQIPQMQTQIQGQMPMQQQQQQMPPQMQQMQQQQVLPQIQGMPPQLQQQLAPPGMPPQISQTPMETEDAPPEETGETTTEGAELPCSIYTFGYGAGHNDSLLQALAEHGRGMYTFIENSNTLGEIFAECLGGLVSIVGQNLKLRVNAKENTDIVRCLSQGFAVKVLENKKVYELTIPDIQSEENRDILFEIDLPALKQANLNWEFMGLSLTYKNVILDKEETIVEFLKIKRSEDGEAGERNFDLDLQHNRIMAALAMEEADKEANAGKLDNARKILTDAETKILKSRSNKHEYSQNLAKDLQKSVGQLRSENEYRSVGAKQLKMSSKAHYVQRSAHSSAYASQAQYQNRSKKAMLGKFSTPQ